MVKPLQAKPSSNQNVDKPKSELDRLMVRWTRIVGIFTGLLFLANAVGLFFIEEQWRAAEAASRDTHEQTRAFLSIQNIAQFIGPNGETGATGEGFSLKITNSGGTRAVSAGGWTSIEYFADSVPNNFDWTRPLKPIISVLTIVPPNGDLPIPAVGIPIKDAEKAYNGEGLILIWGQFSYSTIYAPNKILDSRFCYTLAPVKGAKPIQISGMPESTVGGGQPLLFSFIVNPYKQECNYTN